MRGTLAGAQLRLGRVSGVLLGLSAFEALFVAVGASATLAHGLERSGTGNPAPRQGATDYWPGITKRVSTRTSVGRTAQYACRGASDG